MKYEFLKKTAKKTLASALISVATIVAPSMCEKQGYSNTQTGYNTKQNIEIIEDQFKKSMLEELVKRERTLLLEKRVKEQGSEKIKAPYYKNISPNHCAKYAVKVSKNLFGKEFEKQDAWNLRYKNKIVEEIDSIGEIRELIIDGYLKPGMIIGIYNPKSNKNRLKDLTKHKIKYSHVGVIAGINDNYEVEIIHQIGRKIQKITLSNLEEQGLIPIEVLDISDKPNLTQN